MHIDSVYVGTVFIVSDEEIDLQEQIVSTSYKFIKYACVYRDQYGDYTDLKTKEKYKVRNRNNLFVGDLILHVESLVSLRKLLFKSNIEYKENMSKRKILKILDGGKK